MQPTASPLRTCSLPPCRRSPLHARLPHTPLRACSVRRAWLPNVHLKRLWSDILARHVRINVTPYTLRQVDRMGGAFRAGEARSGSCIAIAGWPTPDATWG